MTAREYDINGWPEIKNNPLSKVGIFPYLGRNIDPSFEPDRIYKVLRPEAELANPQTIESFKLIPWIDAHTMLGDSDSGMTPPEQKGIQGVIGEEVFYENGVLYGNLKLFSESMQDKIEDGIRELSCGYRCRYEISSGIWNGERYDAIQRDIRGNHLALVDEGRMGPDVAVLDHLKFTFDARDIKMPDTKEGEAKSLSLDEVTSMLKEYGPKIAQMQDMITKHFGGSSGADSDVEKENEKKEAEDKAKDEAEKKACEDKAKDEAEEKKEKEGMDAAIKSLTEQLESVKKGGVKAVLGEIKQRDTLAQQLAPFIGAFDHADKTLAEVQSYGVEKLGIKCAKGQEQAALDGFLTNRRAPASEIGFALDGFGSSSATKSDIRDFYSKAS